jgi:outer membrane receptor protein involved in Fe transport
VNNVFDEDPPIYRGTTQGNTNGYSGGTLGRVLQLGISKDFSL